MKKTLTIMFALVVSSCSLIPGYDNWQTERAINKASKQCKAYGYQKDTDLAKCIQAEIAQERQNDSDRRAAFLASGGLHQVPISAGTVTPMPYIGGNRMQMNCATSKGLGNTTYTNCN